MFEFSRNEWRNLLNDAFSDDEFTNFCFDHFPKAFDEFTLQMTKNTKIRKLVAHCERHGLSQKLSEQVREANPHQFESYSNLKNRSPKKDRSRYTITINGDFSSYEIADIGKAFHAAARAFTNALDIPIDALSILESDIKKGTLLIEIPKEVSINNIRATSELLNDFLSLLYPEITNPDILTFDDFSRRYPLTGLGPLAIEAIEISQRANKRSGQLDQIGLNEFHIGLIYLYFDDHRGAAVQFKEARSQWHLVFEIPSISLSYFAEGVAYQHAYAYKQATTCYKKAESLIPLIKEKGVLNHDLKSFTDFLEISLETSLESIKQILSNETQSL